MGRMAETEVTDTDKHSEHKGQDPRQVSPGRKMVFRLLLLACLIAYGFYSYPGFRVAFRACQYLEGGKTATARTAFLYVLDRQSFSLAVPFARASYLYKAPQSSNPGEDRLAIWAFERMIDSTFEKGASSLTTVVGVSPLQAELRGLCTPLTCDFAPLAALLLSILLTLMLFCFFFLKKASSVARRFAGLLVAMAVLTWVFADPYGGLRATLMEEGLPFPAAIAYDYAKYLLAGVILLLTIRQCVYVTWRWTGN